MLNILFGFLFCALGIFFFVRPLIEDQPRLVEEAAEVAPEVAPEVAKDAAEKFAPWTIVRNGDGFFSFTNDRGEVQDESYSSITTAQAKMEWHRHFHENYDPEIYAAKRLVEEHEKKLRLKSFHPLKPGDEKPAVKESPTLEFRMTPHTVPPSPPVDQPFWKGPMALMDSA